MPFMKKEIRMIERVKSGLETLVQKITCSTMPQGLVNQMKTLPENSQCYIGMFRK